LSVRIAPLLLLTTSCTLLVDASLQSGIGLRCNVDADCHASTCESGLCVKKCDNDIDCPNPSRCFVGTCQFPFKVGALWSGVGVGGDGWTHSHKTGMDDAAARLGYLDFGGQPYLFLEQVQTPAAVDMGVDDYVARGADLIVATSFSQRDEILKKADQYPNVKFLTCGGFRPNGKNVGSYFGRYEQGWYIGGKMAALKAKKRIGYIAPESTPGVVRFLNAFLRGAQSVNPNILLEVRWLGFWKDLHDQRTYAYTAKNYPFATDPTDATTLLYREELLAAQMIDSGCEVVIHETDTQRSVAFIDARLGGMGPGGSRLLSLAVDIKDGCRVNADPAGRWLPTCLGAIFWNWGAIYTDLFDQMHRGVWAPTNLVEPISADMRATPFSFVLDMNSGISNDELQSAVVDVAQRDYRTMYQGPYATTGQRDQDGDGVPDPVQAVAAGEVPSEAELSTMCFFAKGVVEKTDPSDPNSPDRDAHVPDGPNGKFPAPQDSVDYVSQYPFLSADHELNCPKNQ
jgi:basic membrane lipoprotein Med (substrate-binding protein (PBP1-ABC) superfamily)